MNDSKRDIKYITRDFNSFRDALIEFSKTYFPTTYNDFSNASPGMMVMEQGAYIGDILSFYLDNQVQETFLQYARQQENIYSLAYTLGYTPKASKAATVDIDFYQRVPAKLSGSVTIPDFSYTIKVPENSVIGSSQRGQNFLVQDYVDFAESSSLDPTQISVYSIDSTTNRPLQYQLKKTRKGVSATIKTTTLTFGQVEKFATRTITDDRILGILDITDSDGNIWYEVPYLGQETVLTEDRRSSITDPNLTDADARYILKLEKQPRRFITRFKNETNLELQFGAGNTNDSPEEIVPDPSNVGLGLPYRRSQLNTAFDPTNFLFTDTYGIAPRNTTLTVRYLTGGGSSANAAANTLTTLSTKEQAKFNISAVRSSANADAFFNSLTVTNPQGASGGGDADDLETIRENALRAFGAQLRAVTADDYLVRALSMPSDYGNIAKAYATPTLASEVTQGEIGKVIDLYVISYNINKNFTRASNTVKNNLRTYLSQYRTVNDKVNIKDAFVINLGIDFEIVTRPGFNSNEVLFNCIEKIKNFFASDQMQINEPISLRDLYLELDKVRGVQTVKKITPTNKSGVAQGYSQYAYDVEGATTDNVIYPSVDPMIFEIKYPDTDIKGRVVSL
jgi:hypothetical protein